ncbi:MAG: helix-turn-helix domain-containing protein [Parvibaculum sp.]|nr:helix-turn-helix domain-containing protein [Parvibaculum sp.]
MTSEIRTLREMFETSPTKEVEAAIPNHTRAAIAAQARKMGLRTPRRLAPDRSRFYVINAMAAHRMAAGKPMEAVARKFGRDRTLIYRWESGAGNPNLSSFLAYAKALGLRVTVEDAKGETVWRQGEIFKGNPK